MIIPSHEQLFDLSAELARIDKMRAELQQTSWNTLRVLQSTTLASPSLLLGGAMAMAALAIASAVIAKFCI